MGPIVCISLVHDYVFFLLYTSYFSSLCGGWGGLLTCYPPFSDFGFENRLNSLYFISTRLYVFFRLYTTYFSNSWGTWDMLPTLF